MTLSCGRSPTCGAEDIEHSAGIMSVPTEKLHLLEDEHLKDKALVQGVNAAIEPEPHREGGACGKTEVTKGNPTSGTLQLC